MNTRNCFGLLRSGLTGRFALLLLGMLSGLNALADSHARIVRLSVVERDVQVDRADGNGFQTAFLNMPVVHGGRVWTRQDGFAEIEFENGSTIHLAPNTILNVNELSLDSSGNKISTVDLQEGLAYFNVKKSGDSEFHILFAHQEVAPEGSTHFRIGSGSEEIVVAVFSGEIHLRNNSPLDVRISKGESLTLNAEDKSRYFLAKSIPEEGSDSWDQQRIDYHDNYALAKAQEEYSLSNSYGTSDLNYYGSYFPVGGYGNLWRPHNVGLDWDPFANGSWIYYPGYGYVWASGHPWGWRPYRSGRWIFVPSHGWCWQPEHHWQHWAGFPGISNPPPNFHRPVPPRTPNPGVIVRYNPGPNGPNGVGAGSHPRVNAWTNGRLAIPPAGTEPDGGASPSGRGSRPVGLNDENVAHWGGRSEVLERKQTADPVAPAAQSVVIGASPTAATSEPAKAANPAAPAGSAPGAVMWGANPNDGTPSQTGRGSRPAGVNDENAKGWGGNRETQELKQTADPAAPAAQSVVIGASPAVGTTEPAKAMNPTAPTVSVPGTVMWGANPNGGPPAQTAVPARGLLPNAGTGAPDAGRLPRSRDVVPPAPQTLKVAPMPQVQPRQTRDVVPPPSTRMYVAPQPQARVQQVTPTPRIQPMPQPQNMWHSSSPPPSRSAPSPSGASTAGRAAK